MLSQKIHCKDAEVHLGGLPMITDDMMSFIQSDIVVFGFGVFYIYCN